MELMFAWFWIVKLLVGGVIIGAIVMAFKSKFKNWFWNGLAIVGILFWIYMPVKMVSSTNTVNTQMNYEIKQQKTLPPMIKDNRFRDAADKVSNDSMMNQEIK